jgi:hypothetical protein
MAQYSYPNAGEMFRGLARWLQENLLVTPVSNSGFSIGPILNPPTYRPPYVIEVVSALPSSPDTFWPMDGAPGGNGSLRTLMSTPGLFTGIDCNFQDPGSGFLTFTFISEQLGYIRSAWVNYWGGSTQRWINNGVLTDGGTNAWAGLYVLVAGTATEYQVFCWADFNRAYGPPFPDGFVDVPYQQLPVGLAVANAAPAVINVGNPLDVDLSINSGQAIYSVVGKATTMLPP